MFTKRIQNMLTIFIALFTLFPVASVRAETADGAGFFAPEAEDPQETVAWEELAGVPEVLRLPPAESVAAETLQSLQNQRVAPGVPYQNGFERTAPATRVEVTAEGSSWTGGGLGEVRTTAESRTSWSGRFVVERSYAFRVRLADLEIPEGAQIWVYANRVRLGPFSGELLDPEGGVWLPPAPGPEVVVEIDLSEADPAKSSSPLSFRVGEVMELVETAADATPQAWTDCDIDAVCIDTSTLSTIDVLREATARLSFVVGGGSYLCSGGLINDKDESGFRPYLLTANHCFDTQTSASSLVAYFDYRTSSCNGTAPALWNVPSVTGATLLASNPGSDFTFVELSDNPSGYNWYLGWTTADPSSGTSLYRVSHPQGTPQKYSAASFTGSSGIVCSSRPTSDYHYSAGYEGSTSGGSSGSPVTVNDGGITRVVGQLYGVCRYTPWDDCNYSTYNLIDGAFSTTFPHIRYWINDLTTCGDSYESDDSAGAASPIFSGSPQSHSICPAGDEDWVTFSLGAESAISLETSGPSGDTRMWLYDAGLSQVEFDDDGGSGFFSFIDRSCGVDALPAGTYYVKIDEYGDDDEIPDYTLAYDILQSCGGSCSTNLTLSYSTLTGTQSYRAGDTITLGPSLVVTGTSIDMLAGQSIVIGSGTEIGGSFSAGTDPAACSL